MRYQTEDSNQQYIDRKKKLEYIKKFDTTSSRLDRKSVVS